MTERIRIAGAGVAAEIAPYGAELQTLTDAGGRDLLWSGDTAVWSGRAPILFPIVGALSQGHYRVDGREYPLEKHGFARRRPFDVMATTPHEARLRLTSDDDTREIYPFEFSLEIRFATAAATLTMEAVVTNPGDVPLPASFGFHPAFCWPLPYGAPRDEHRLRFAEPEPGPIRRIDDQGLLRPQPMPTPVDGCDLILRDELFADDAVIFDAPRSRSLAYGAPGAPVLHVDWDGLPMLGTWTKPGAGYICVEPWAGIADPAGFTGDFRDKPGIFEVAPGGSRRMAMHVTLLPDFP